MSLTALASTGQAQDAEMILQEAGHEGKPQAAQFGGQYNSSLRKGSKKSAPEAARL
jgi:hypothetical protein